MAGPMRGSKRKRICVVGAGVSGLSAAWLLSDRFEVTLYEREPRLGGHVNTVRVERGGGLPPIAVDTGFIVYNETTYPNLTALFETLGVETRASDMSFSVSAGGGRLEYGSSDLKALFAQKRNLLNPRFWSLLNDLRRFYRTAPDALAQLDEAVTLGEFLLEGRYGDGFVRSHILPQAAAIWSSDLEDIRAYPAAAFLRFFLNHGLLELDVQARPQWRTVVGGSDAYLRPLVDRISGTVEVGLPALSVRRAAEGVGVRTARGEQRFDEIVLAVHAPDALNLLEDPTEAERALLGAIRYRPNRAVLHTDPALMPRRRAAWSAWNYLSEGSGPGEVAYWMNRLQGLPPETDYFVSLNPRKPPRPETVLAEIDYAHPVFDRAALQAQKALWSLQGRRRTWFCGAWFGSGFHEDGLQSGLAVGEALAGINRPWSVRDPNGRIHLGQVAAE